MVIWGISKFPTLTKKLLAILVTIAVGTLGLSLPISAKSYGDVPPPPPFEGTPTNSMGPGLPGAIIPSTQSEIPPPPSFEGSPGEVVPNLPSSFTTYGWIGAASSAYGWYCGNVYWAYHYVYGPSHFPGYWIGNRSCTYYSIDTPLHVGHFHFYPRPGWTHYHTVYPPTYKNNDVSATLSQYTSYRYTLVSTGAYNGDPWTLYTAVYYHLRQCV